MTFNKTYLKAYKTLLQTTELQKGYQEFIKLFRFLRTELEKALPEYAFSGSIVENAMDYSYFQFVDEGLKQKGLKMVVSFIHKDFCLEVWASGYNRKIQCEYYEKLKNKSLKYTLNDNPNRIDYILKAPLNESLDLSDGFHVLCKIKTLALEMIDYIKKEPV